VSCEKYRDPALNLVDRCQLDTAVTVFRLQRREIYLHHH